jgi:hypothetical protein
MRRYTKQNLNSSAEYLFLKILMVLFVMLRQEEKIIILNQ